MARRSSAGIRGGAVNYQVVKRTWPLVSAQKGLQEEKPLEYIKRQGSTGVGVDRSHRSNTGGQGIETQLSSLLVGTGLQVKDGRVGYWFN